MDEKILFVEDDSGIREVTARALSKAGFDVVTEMDGRRAASTFSDGKFDVVILDLMLPGMDGIDICRHIRLTSPVPIIMLTARSDASDIVMGLEVGADDYVTKPFDLAVLVARVRAVLRRGDIHASEDTIEVGGLRIDRGAFKVFKGDEEIKLSATEFRLLDELSRSAGIVLTREILLDSVWGYDYLGDSRLVDMAVKRLRSKVEVDPTQPELIQTVRGIGYRLER